MESWWYSLVGESDMANAWDGGTLPEKTDFTRASFLSQFTKRMENRRGIHERLSGSGLSACPIISAGNSSITRSSTYSGFVKSIIDQTSNYYNIVTSGIMPVDGDSGNVQLSDGATICSAELETLNRLNTGDVFWSSELFEAIYSITEKIKCFYHVKYFYEMSCDRYRVRVWHYIDGYSVNEYQGEPGVGYYRSQVLPRYGQVSIESDAVVFQTNAQSVQCSLDYRLLFLANKSSNALIFECQRPLAENVLTDTGVSACDVSGATLVGNQNLSIPIGDIREGTRYYGETPDGTVGYDMEAGVSALVRDDLI